MVEAEKILGKVMVTAFLTADYTAAGQVKEATVLQPEDTRCIEAVVAAYVLSGALGAISPQLAQEICDDGKCTI